MTTTTVSPTAYAAWLDQFASFQWKPEMAAKFHQQAADLRKASK